jgi:flagellar secretion chaperone FliS
LESKVNTYRDQEILTASPARLVAMLYDKAVSCLHDTIAAIEAGDIERRYKSSTRATEIISHLAITLDMDRGGEIAKNLEQIYRFILKHLLDVNIHNDAKAAQDVIRLLEPLRASWHELAAKGVTAAGRAPAKAGTRPAASNLSLSA